MKEPDYSELLQKAGFKYLRQMMECCFVLHLAFTKEESFTILVKANSVQMNASHIVIQLNPPVKFVAETDNIDAKIHKDLEDAEGEIVQLHTLDFSVKQGWAACWTGEGAACGELRECLELEIL
jgi:hypothetical protein